MKASLDPVVVVLVMIIGGFLTSFRTGRAVKKQSVRINLLSALSFLYLASKSPFLSYSDNLEPADFMKGITEVKTMYDPPSLY